MVSQTILALQTDIVWENLDANHRTWERLLVQAQPEPGSIVVLPEMAASGFSMNLEATAEESPSASESVCKRLAVHWKVHLVCGLVQKTTSGLGYNQSVVFGPDGLESSRYTKMQLFTLGGEANVHIPGKSTVITEINGIKVGLFVCYDLRFPELFRESARQGAELFIVIACWPSKRADHWVTLLRARAIENQAWVVGVNRAGTDPNYTYPGKSLIVDCHGVVQADAGSLEGSISSRMEIEELRQWRRDFPALLDRRLDH